MLSWHGEDRELLYNAGKRLSVLTREQVNFSQIITKRYSFFTRFIITLLKYYYHNYSITLLKAYISNSLQYFTDKLCSHEPSRIHNTRQRVNSNFNTSFK